MNAASDATAHWERDLNPPISAEEHARLVQACEARRMAELNAALDRMRPVDRLRLLAGLILRQDARDEIERLYKKVCKTHTESTHKLVLTILAKPEFVELCEVAEVPFPDTYSMFIRQLRKTQFVCADSGSVKKKGAA